MNSIDALSVTSLQLPDHETGNWKLETRQPFSNNKGAILFTVLIILIFLSTLGLSSVAFLLSRLTKSNLELDRLKALYLAEAGISKSIYELKRDKDLDNNGVGNVLKTKLAGGTYKATHNFQVSAIKGIGEYNGIKRKIRIKYNAL